MADKTKKLKTEKKSIDSLLKYPSHNIAFGAGIDKSEKSEIIIKFLASEKSDDKKKNDSEAPILKQFPFFAAGAGEVVKSEKTWFAGVGALDDLTVDVLGLALISIAKDAAKSFVSVTVDFDEKILKKIAVDKIARLAITAFGVAAFPVDFLKSKPESEGIKLTSVNFNVSGENKKIWDVIQEPYSRLINHINGMRQVQSLPANYITPETMEKRARAMAAKFGLKMKVFNRAELEKMSANGIVSVGKGSVIPPRMIVLEYTPSKSASKLKTLAFVGKGVTFDTGGISIKPSSDMHEMKYDMSGAAASIHAIAAVAEMKLNIKVVAAIGLAENMPDGAAIKPGDVYTAYNGKTIEVQNTDAEGRLILGDVLSYVDKNYKPDFMVDLATLTGACMVALGSYYAGLFSDHAFLRDTLSHVSAKSLEPIWQLPMGPLYLAQMKSDIADYNNIGDRWGGASSAASFLSVFVDKSTPWAHLDIAGIADIKKGFNVYPAVATGFGVRLLTELALELSK
ncbi:MAG: leucyl aminopeptidase [Spirochaetia bacterium]|nr:leucyl aminopeptidase [Spirochaetia bacterium]